MRVLLIENEHDEKNVAEILSTYNLKDDLLRLDLTRVDSIDEATIMLDKKGADVVLLSLPFPDTKDVDTVRSICNRNESPPVVVITDDSANAHSGIELVRAGAQDYIPKRYTDASVLVRTMQYAIERHSMSKQIEYQALTLKHVNEELEAINEEMETFAYITSHDLRSPLRNLKGFSGELHRGLDIILPMLETLLPKLSEVEQELLQKEVCERIPRALAYINIASDKMEQMTDAILKLSRLGRRDIVFEPVDTNMIVMDCLESLAYQIDKSCTKVNVDDLPVIQGDRAYIEQIFANLLDNAIKYMKPECPGKIDITSMVDGDFIQFSVRDNGCGIAEENMHKVFEIFRRAGNVENIPGEGMGMPYVRAIVRKHGGNIWCESVLGEGSVFHFTIAQRQDNKEAA